MARQVWLCDNCKTPYEHSDEATQCEHAHKKRMVNATIQDAGFKSLEGSYGIDRGERQMYPERVVIKFSENHGDFALYSLVRIGPKAL